MHAYPDPDFPPRWDPDFYMGIAVGLLLSIPVWVISYLIFRHA